MIANRPRAKGAEGVQRCGRRRANCQLGARVSLCAPSAGEIARSALPERHAIMKTALIATLFALAATAAAAAATAQLDSPVARDAEPVLRAEPATPRAPHSRLHVDRERVKADKERLKAARAARDDDAIRTEQARLRDDMATWHADRERHAELGAGDSLKR